MNDSGDAVQQALRFYKLDVDALTVFHDELDLAPMKVKVKLGGGTAGHNGLRSIDAHLGPDFRGCGSGSAIPATRTGSPPTCSAITPKPSSSAGRPARGDRREADWLAEGDDARFMSEVALGCSNGQ
jgi:peptidyl-tRNA hydrolase, PTH1 family